jgi:hypothetical protein
MGIFAHVQGHSFTFGCGVLLVIHWLEFRTLLGGTGTDQRPLAAMATTGRTQTSRARPTSPLLGRATQHPAAVGVQPSPRCIARQRLPHISLGQAELPGDLRGFDASLEGRANRVQLTWRQMNGGRLMLPVRGYPVSSGTQNALHRYSDETKNTAT